MNPDSSTQGGIPKLLTRRWPVVYLSAIVILFAAGAYMLRQWGTHDSPLMRASWRAGGTPELVAGVTRDSRGQPVAGIGFKVTTETESGDEWHVGVSDATGRFRVDVPIDRIVELEVGGVERFRPRYLPLSARNGLHVDVVIKGTPPPPQGVPRTTLFDWLAAIRTDIASAPPVDSGLPQRVDHVLRRVETYGVRALAGQVLVLDATVRHDPSVRGADLLIVRAVGSNGHLLRLEILDEQGLPLGAARNVAANPGKSWLLSAEHQEMGVAAMEVRVYLTPPALSPAAVAREEPIDGFEIITLPPDWPRRPLSVRLVMTGQIWSEPVRLRRDVAP